jgi:hypothetical protein
VPEALEGSGEGKREEVKREKKKTAIRYLKG